MKKILITILTLFTFAINAQEKEKKNFFKGFYEDFLSTLQYTLLETTELLMSRLIKNI
jgi:hypothetical protein